MGYGELLRGNRNFRYLWFGQIISLLGDWFNLIASTSLIAALTESSGTAIGALFVVRMLAPFLVSPIAGVVADRYNRKHILIVTDIVRALTVFGFLLVRNAEDIWLIYVLTAIQLGVSGFFFPTRIAILPDIVAARGVGAANAISSATWSVMLALGAAVGGLVSGLWGVYPAFIIDGFTFILSAFFLAQIAYRLPDDLAASDKTVSAALRQYADGLRYVWRFKDVLVVAMQKAAIAFFMVAGFQVIQVAIAEEVFPIGEGGGISLGLMFAMAGVGSGIGPIAARYFTGDRDRPLRGGILVGYAMGIVGFVITAPLLNFALVLFGVLVRGLGGGIVWVFSTQLLLQGVSGDVRGRVFATEFAFFTLASAVGAALAGGALDVVGIQGILWVMAAFTVIPLILWAVWMGQGGREQRGRGEGERGRVFARRKG
jgi:MFS family permease